MRKIASWIIKSKRKILLLSLILGGVALFLSTNLEVASDFESMLPDDSPTLEMTKMLDDYFPNNEEAVLVIEGLDLLESIKEEVESHHLVGSTFAYLDLSYLGSRSMLYGSDKIYFNKDNQYMMVVKAKIDDDNFVNERKEFYDFLSQYQTNDGKILLTGGAFIQDHEADTIAFDGMGIKVLLTLVLILVLLMVVMKSFRYPLILAVPLILGTILTTAFAYLTFGSLNMFSVSFAMLLLGLGVDFGIHLLVGIRASENLSIKEGIADTGGSILFGALTTGFAFVAFTFGEFKAFAQMGIISGVGVMIMSLVTLLILPNIIGKVSPLKSSTNGKHKSTPMFILLILIPLLTLLPQVSEAKVIGDMDKIYPVDLPSRINLKVLEEVFEYSPEVFSVLVEEKDALGLIETLKAMNEVKSVRSIYDFLPPNQEETIASMGLDFQPINIDELPEDILMNYKSGNIMKLDIETSFNAYDIEAFESFNKTINKLTGRGLSGIAALMNEIIQMVKKDITLISTACIIMIFVMLFLVYKSIKITCVTIAPVILTVYTTVGVLPLIDRDINIFSIAAFPLILGIGIDSSIHLVHRKLKNKELYTVTKGILMTTLTTVIGFGSLGLVNHPGMANLGITVAIGMIFNLLYSILIIWNIPLNKSKMPVKE